MSWLIPPYLGRFQHKLVLDSSEELVSILEESVPDSSLVACMNTPLLLHFGGLSKIFLGRYFEGF